MQLVYAYAKKFRCFHDQAFNLVGCYEVAVRKDWSGITIKRLLPFRQKMPDSILSVCFRIAIDDVFPARSVGNHESHRNDRR